MGPRRYITYPPCQEQDQSWGYLHQKDAWRNSFLASTRFVHVLTFSSDFLHQTYLDVHLSCQQDEPVRYQVMPSAASFASGAICGSYLSALCYLPLCNTRSSISHLSSAGRQLMWCSLWVIPSILWDVVLEISCSLRQWFFFSLLPLDAFSSHQIHPGWFFLLFFLDARMMGVGLSLFH